MATRFDRDEDRANFLEFCGELYDNIGRARLFDTLMTFSLEMSMSTCPDCWAVYATNHGCPYCAENQPLEPDQRPELTDYERNR